MWAYVTSHAIMKRRGKGTPRRDWRLEWAQVRGRTADPWTSRICAGGWPETVRRWRHTWSRVCSPWSSCPPPPAEACTWRKSWKAERDRVYGNTNVYILTFAPTNLRKALLNLCSYVGFKPLLFYFILSNTLKCFLQITKKSLNKQFKRTDALRELCSKRPHGGVISICCKHPALE